MPNLTSSQRNLIQQYAMDYCHFMLSDQSVDIILEIAHTPDHKLDLERIVAAHPFLAGEAFNEAVREGEK